MIDPRRLIRSTDKFHAAFPGLNFPETFAFQTRGEPVLVTDPTYLADVYNSPVEPALSLREHGCFLMDFGGDTSCPVWWKPPLRSDAPIAAP